MKRARRALPVHWLVVGRTLQVLRTRQGTTQAQLAAQAGVSVGRLSEIERGQAPLEPSLLCGLADGPGVPTAQLLNLVHETCERFEAALRHRWGYVPSFAVTLRELGQPQCAELITAAATAAVTAWVKA